MAILYSFEPTCFLLRMHLIFLHVLASPKGVVTPFFLRLPPYRETCRRAQVEALEAERLRPPDRVRGPRNGELLTTFVLVAFLFLFPSPVFADNHEEDRARASKIEEIYDGYKRSFPAVRDMSAEEAMKRFQEGTVIFVDEREPEEQAVSMLPGAIRSKDFLRNPARFKDKLVVGYCTISYRSGVLAKKLQEKGIPMVNLRGGILAWLHAGGKVYRDGKPVNEVHVYGKKWNLAPSSYQAIW